MSAIFNFTNYQSGFELYNFTLLFYNFSQLFKRYSTFYFKYYSTTNSSLHKRCIKKYLSTINISPSVNYPAILYNRT